MIVRTLKENFLSNSKIPDEVRELVAAAFEKGAFAMVGSILSNAENIRKLDKFLGKIETEQQLYLEENPCEMFVPFPDSISPKAVFADDPMWFEPHNGLRGELYHGLTDYNSTIYGRLDVKHIGGDTDYYFLVDGDGREWGVKKISRTYDFNNAPNADEFWFNPSEAYIGQEIVGLTLSGQNIFGGKLFKGPYYGAWYAKSPGEELGVEIIKICLPEVYKKMQEIRDAKDLRDEK